MSELSKHSSIQTLLTATPQLSSVFAKYGFSNFTNPEFVKKLVSFLKLGTFLRYNNIDTIEIVFPKEGALVSPVQILVKKSTFENTAFITDFLLGQELQQHCANNFFPSFHPDVINTIPDECKLYWIGWNFIYCNDIGQIKETLRTKFTAEFLRTGKRECA